MPNTCIQRQRWERSNSDYYKAMVLARDGVCSGLAKFGGRAGGGQVAMDILQR